MGAQRPVSDRVAVLTRPAPANTGLSERLKGQGWTVLEAPALTIQPLALTDSEWVLPEAADLVVFVSGNAARIYLDRLSQNPAYEGWPHHVVAATVGEATARALRAHPAFGASPRIVVPNLAGTLQDSEGLFLALKAEAVVPRRVLIVRGDSGRQWLADQFLAQGSRVDFFGVYSRRPASWDVRTAQTLARWQSEGAYPVWVYTSTASIQSVLSNILALGLGPWWCQCAAVVTHPRLAEALAEATQRASCDYAGTQVARMVKICLPDDCAVFEAFVAL